MSTQQLQKAIENPTLELKIVSASDVNHVDATDKIDVYAVVSINGRDATTQTAKTPIDYDGGSNPTWNHTVKFSVNEREANGGLSHVKIELFSYCLDDKVDLYLGEVNVSVQDLLALNPIPPFIDGNVDKMKPLICPVNVTESGSTKATLSLLYRFKPVRPVPLDDAHSPGSEYSPSIGQPVYPNTDQPISGQPMVFSQRFQSTATKLILEIMIKFAKQIEHVNAFSSMDVYASVAILKDRKVRDRINTPIAFSANTNPKWNQTIKFSFDEKLVQDGRLILLVELMSHRPFLGDKEIGSVRLPIQQLLSSNPPSTFTNNDTNGMKMETHALMGPYGKKGVVSFTYRFLAEQVTISTAPPQPSTTSKPYIMYIPVSPHSYASSDPVHVTSSYMAVQQGGDSRPSNGLVPIYMPSTYQSHGYQQYLPRHGQTQPQTQPQPQPQLPPQPQQSQLKPVLPQQPFTESLPDTQEA